MNQQILIDAYERGKRRALTKVAGPYSLFPYGTGKKPYPAVSKFLGWVNSRADAAKAKVTKEPIKDQPGPLPSSTNGIGSSVTGSTGMSATPSGRTM